MLVHALAAVASACLAGQPGDPGLTITWQTDDAKPVMLEPAGTFNPGQGWWNYSGFAIDPDTGVTINYNLNAHVAVEEVELFATAVGTLVSGNVTIENPFLPTVVQRVTITVPSAEMPAGAAAAAAAAAIGLVTDSGGGSISALPGGAVWTGLVDGGGVFVGYPYPFFMEPNCGIIGCQGFTLPFPEPAPPVTDSVGIRLEFELTQQDQASITSVFVVATLLGDLDGDRTVGVIDLLQLLASWGPCGQADPCDADLDGTGAVDADDFELLLANWG